MMLHVLSLFSSRPSKDVPYITIVEWDGEGIEETLLLTTRASLAYTSDLPR
jgi:hypothetical protein